MRDFGPCGALWVRGDPSIARHTAGIAQHHYAVTKQPCYQLDSLDKTLVQLAALDNLPLYCRTGKCEEQAKGQCRLLHDRTKVAVCPAWLNGSCATLDCPLQHEARPELMPLCTFFLKVNQSRRVQTRTRSFSARVLGGPHMACCRKLVDFQLFAVLTVC